MKLHDLQLNTVFCALALSLSSVATAQEGRYFAVLTSPWSSVSVHDTEADPGVGVDGSFGTAAFKSTPVIDDIGGAIGFFIVEPKSGARFRHQYGLRSFRLNMDLPTFEGIDPIVDSIASEFSFDAEVRVFAPLAEGYIDIPLGDDSGNFFYVGAGGGWVNARANTSVGIDSAEISIGRSDWIRLYKYEIGILLNRALQLGYEWSRTGPADFVVDDGMMEADAQTLGFDRSLFKISIVFGGGD